MCTKALAFLALATIANANDIIVGLKTDGTKFFDENRQANPALWRQIDNVTIKAPENEVIRRVVITDLRPEKDGDVKIVEGGEGQKNVTIELKSPTVLRGYEFHIEVYSTPEGNVPFTNDQQSTTEHVQTDSTTGISSNPTTNLDTTSKLPDLTTDKIVPAVVSNDEIKDSERQGRNAKNDDNVTNESTTEVTSTTFKNDASTTPESQSAAGESVTNTHSEKSADASYNFKDFSTISPIPLNKNFNINPVLPAISGKDIENDKINVSGSDETRHVRDTEKEISEKPTEAKLKDDPVKVPLGLTTENDKEASTTEIPVEEKSEAKGKEDATTKFTTFDGHKHTSAISSKDELPHNPIEVKDAEKPRNAREANEEQNVEESISTTPGEVTTIDFAEETTTLSGEDCVTTEASLQNPTNIGKDVGKIDPVPIYVNNRQWNQRINSPAFQVDNTQNFPDQKLNPAVLNDQSTLAPDTEHLGDNFKPSPDHMENRNSKISPLSRPR